MAPYTDFQNLIAQRSFAWVDLDPTEELQFGHHAYVLKEEINITTLLEDVASQQTKNGTPIHHLHLYCHRLTGTVTSDGQLHLPLSAAGLMLTSLYIFAVEFENISQLLVDTTGTLDLRLFYDVDSGPREFWVSTSSASSDRIHVLQRPHIRLDCDEKICGAQPHLDLSEINAAGARIFINGQAKSLASQLIPSVPWEELRPARLSEFEKFGAHRRRLQNLPRLLFGLFDSAGREIMGEKPDIDRVLAKLRFIKRCARSAPHFAGFVLQTDILLSRLELPRSFNISDSANEMDWFYVPKVSAGAIHQANKDEMSRLIKVTADLEAAESVQKIASSIDKSNGSIIAALKLTTEREVEDTRIKSAKSRAEAKSLAVSQKMTELIELGADMKEKATQFKEGMMKYQEKQRWQFWKEVVVGLGGIGLSIGMAVYSGPAGVALTVGAFNTTMNAVLYMLMNGKFHKLTISQEIPADGKNPLNAQGSSNVNIAFKALFESAWKVYPKIQAAYDKHPDLSETGTKSTQRLENINSHLGKAADGITNDMYSSEISEMIDFTGLLGDWRELTLNINAAFDTIKDQLTGGEVISGMSDYHQALKKLAVRGEVLVPLMGEAQDARNEYLQLLAEKIARAKVMAELDGMKGAVEDARITNQACFLALKDRLTAEIAQRRRIMFNTLHQGVLAAIYHKNNPKLQKTDYSRLSPALSTNDMSDMWSSFSNFVWQPETSQDRSLTVKASKACPPTWRDLMLKDHEFPFQIPADTPRAAGGHRLRLRSIYVTFVGLKQKEETRDPLTYYITLGPLMLDRAASPDHPESPELATQVQYYTTPRYIVKDGKNNKIQNKDGKLSDVALSCQGTVSFTTQDLEGWNLEEVTDVEITVHYEMSPFPPRKN